MEIEIKAKVNNLTSLRRQVLKLGAKKICDKHQVDVYLSPPHKSFFNTRHYLRVRQDLINKTSVFEYKLLKSSGQYSASQETEVGIKDGKILLRILKQLDFTEICTVDKKREVFKYKDFEIVLDKVKNLGNFIEVELEGNFRNREKHKNRIIQVLDKLNIKQSQYCEYGGYVEIMTKTSAKDWDKKTITICGSMQFADKMQKARKELEAKGFKVFLPEATESGASLKTRKDYSKLKAGFIKKHFEHIKNSDAILVLNYTKNNIKNYIGGNTLLEMGLAFYFNKPIYLINPAPIRVRYAEEIDAMGVVVINSDLDKIKS